MSDEQQGPRTRNVITLGKGTAAVEVPVGYERRLTPAEVELVRVLVRDMLARDHRK